MPGEVLRDLVLDARLRDELVARGMLDPREADRAGVPGTADLRVLPEDAVLRLIARRDAGA